MLNLIGSVLFLIASISYYFRTDGAGHMGGGRWGWEYQVAEWGVRFTFALGSACFTVAAAASLRED